MLLLCAFTMICLGLVMVFSAVASLDESTDWYKRRDMRQAVFAGIAAIALFLLWRIDYRKLAGTGPFPRWMFALFLLSVVVGALVLVPGIRHEAGGKFRWIKIGPKSFGFRIQPSEIIKVVMVLFLACWLTRPGVKIRSWKTFGLGVLVLCLAEAFVIKADLGTGILIAMVWGMTLLLAGVPWHRFLALIPPAAAAGSYLMFSDPYRLNRFKAWLNPWGDDTISSYHTRQSLLSVFSGDWFGMGPGNGVRKLGFLPEDSTDFLFASYCEEWGFVGAVLLIGLWLMLLRQCQKAASRAEDSLGRVLAVALGGMLILQAILHIAVNLVLLPPTGVALPLMSAGGTGLVLSACCVAVIGSVAFRPGHWDDDELTTPTLHVH
jgi:cell division protein FtsW